MRFQIRERFSKLLFLGVVLFSGFLIMAEEGKIYAGCPTGSYCAGTTVLDRKWYCNVFDNYCTQKYLYKDNISCDSNCAYKTYAYLCDFDVCPPTNSGIYTKDYHQGSCCVYPARTCNDCTTKCPSGYTKGSCPSGETCVYADATCTKQWSDGSGSCGTKTDTNACYKITSSPSCSCGTWTNGSCGGGSCAYNQRQQTRDCNPDGCDTESQCVADSSCECSTVTCPSRCSDTYDCQRVGWSYDTCEYSSCDEALVGYNYNVDRWEDPTCYFSCGDCTPECPSDYPLTSPPSGPYSSKTVKCDKISSCGGKCGEVSRTCYKSECTGCDCNASCGGTYPLTSCSWPNCQSTSTCCQLKDSCGNSCTVGGSSQECRTCYRCVPGSCTGCTPSCPSGQSTVVSGPLCAQSLSSCTGNNGCGSSCTRTGDRCYLPETNTTPSTPSSLTMTIDGVNYILDTSSASPKVVKYPTFNNIPTVSIPSMSTPSTARNLTYDFQANNEGYNNPEWTNFECSRGEDFCIYNQGANQTNFTPNSESLEDVLEQGASGRVSSRYSTLNKCDDNTKYSSFLDTYYVVNNLPRDPIPPDPTSPPIGSMCPTIMNNTLELNQRGCNSTSYTGTEVNNPLKFELTASDPDGIDEIKGAIVWLSKNGTISQIPDIPTIAGTYQYSDPNHIAVMILQRNGSWDNSPLLYAPDSTNGYNWGNITSSKQILTTEGVMGSVSNVDVNISGENVNFYVELTLNEVSLGQTIYPEGNYNISGLVLDEHMLLAGGTVVDQFYMSTDCRAGGWNIDLRRPIFESGSPTSETIFAKTLKFSWNFNGTGSYATDVVINGYSDSATKDIILETPPGYPNISPTPPPPDDNIGVLTDPNAWAITNSVAGETYNSDARINIGLNDSGTIIFYVTGFDQACNTTNKSVTINFNPWIASKGGFVYSGSNVGANAKDYTAYSTFINSVLRKVTAEELDIGTEVVTSRSGTINDFIHPELSAVRASSIYNSNSQMSSWYEYFSDRLNEQMANTDSESFKEFQFPEDEIILNNRISDYCDASEEEYCYMNIQGDLNVVPAYIYNVSPLGERRKELICDKKTLIMASGDIHIEPDIINGGDDNINGCIFIAGGSITVGAGDWVSQNATELEDTRYDYLDAFLVADDIIDIQFVDLKEPGEEGSVIYTRDGLEIYGGLVAFGQNIPTGTSAVQANRSFGLWNAYIPVTTITWDPRYAKLAEAFFGSTAGMYKREVGFKPY